MPSPELRVTIVIADDPETEETEIRALGDHFLPAPIRGPMRDFAKLWEEFGRKLNDFRGSEARGRTSWG